MKNGSVYMNIYLHKYINPNKSRLLRKYGETGGQNQMFVFEKTEKNSPTWNLNHCLKEMNHKLNLMTWNTLKGIHP